MYVCMYVCPAVHKVLLLRNYSPKSFQNWQADALGHPDVPLSKWSWSDWHCGHKSQIVMTTKGGIYMLQPALMGGIDGCAACLEQPAFSRPVSRSGDPQM